MKKISRIAFAPIILGISLCTSAFSQIEKIYLNPKVPANELQSRFIDTIRFIPLTAKEKMNISIYNSIDIASRHILLTDYSTGTLYIYNRKGVFLKKVNYKKLGNKLYPFYNEATDQIIFRGSNKHYKLTPRDHIKIELDRSNSRNRKYFKKFIIDLKDTAFVLQKTDANEYDIINAKPYYDDYYISNRITTNPMYKDSTAYELNIYRNYVPIKSYFPYNRINEPKYLYASEFISNIETGKMHIRYITRPYCDTIYKLIKDSLHPVFKLVLPLENMPPPEFFTTPFKNKAERENHQRNNGWMLRQIFYLYENTRYILLHVGFNNNHEKYIYNKTTKLAYNYKNIKPDSVQYNLKLFDRLNTGQKEDDFYILKQAGELMSFFEKNKTITAPKNLSDFLKKKSG